MIDWPGGFYRRDIGWRAFYQISLFATLTVMPGLEPGIQARKTCVWMAGSSPAMNLRGPVRHSFRESALTRDPIQLYRITL
jgi:hypothetical protein